MSYCIGGPILDAGFSVPFLGYRRTGCRTLGLWCVGVGLGVFWGNNARRRKVTGYRVLNTWDGGSSADPKYEST